MHHVLADGIGGLAVLAHLVDGMPTTTRHPTFAARLRPAARSSVTRSRRGWRVLAHVPAGVRLLRAGIAELAAAGTAGAPRSSLNQPIGARRSLAVARADLRSVQRAAHAHGATVNDVVLTAVTGALNAVLRHRGESIDRFVISVPVSTRRDVTADQPGNQVGVMTVPVATAGDPHQRLTAIARVTRGRRPTVPSAAAVLGPAFRTLAWLGLYQWFVDRQHRITTLVTNLRGPDVALSFLAAPIISVIPVSPITGNVTVAFAVLSYAGTLAVTVIADPERCPDLPVLVAQLQDDLDLLAGEPAGRRRSAAG